MAKKMVSMRLEDGFFYKADKWCRYLGLDVDDCSKSEMVEALLDFFVETVFDSSMTDEDISKVRYTMFHALDNARVTGVYALARGNDNILSRDKYNNFTVAEFEEKYSGVVK